MLQRRALQVEIGIHIVYVGTHRLLLSVAAKDLNHWLILVGIIGYVKRKYAQLKLHAPAGPFTGLNPLSCLHACKLVCAAHAVLDLREHLYVGEVRGGGRGGG